MEERAMAANHAPLSPLSFLYRSAAVFGDKTSLIHGASSFTWSQTLDRCRRLASAISLRLGVNPGAVVSVVAPNVAAIYEMHFGVPMVGAILNTINFRLDARTIALLLDHAQSRAVFVDSEFFPLVTQALQLLAESSKPLPELILIKDKSYTSQAAHSYGGILEYEELLENSSPDFPLVFPDDEEQSIALNYTSGTTSRPKGVLYTHRGAYLNSIASILLWEMGPFPVYLWTLPMFHCNGWCFTWAIAAQGGTNICLRNVTAKATFDAIAESSVTHLSGAPTVLNMIASSIPSERRDLPHKVAVRVGGAPPPPAILSSMEELGFVVTHSYGLTETYGPALFCAWRPHWNSFPLEERAKLKSRQGVVHLGLHQADVKDPATMESVARDGRTLGEVMVRGSTVMKGYHRDDEATRAAFQGGWFHTGDLGVIHPDGYIQLRDRSKDIIISGGENISSIEVESILYGHPEVLEAAVVARPDDFWGETPCAFVTLKRSGGATSAREIIDYCRARLPHFMVPRSVVFGALPKTSTGKVQKFLLRDRARAMGSLRAPSKL
ncbi:probable acyl-activating enzyme 1, peroxisomal [Selaginella moellendorffii]|nr:probable acyl-activating enzyme 1, peroxisomal [Selaginella moellendorffii]|eukprot:XP_002967798.2 probable acyl-activating enzyme 1, peroxisomal [Selaginella moellendorffii]